MELVPVIVVIHVLMFVMQGSTWMAHHARLIMIIIVVKKIKNVVRNIVNLEQIAV